MEKELCYSCGSYDVVEIEINDDVPYRDRVYNISYPATQCKECSEIYLSSKQGALYEKELVKRYKEDNGLLLGKDLVEIRENFGLTQAELEKAFGCGKNTIHRWEKDLVPQPILANAAYQLLDFPWINETQIMMCFPNFNFIDALEKLPDRERYFMQFEVEENNPEEDAAFANLVQFDSYRKKKPA